MPLEKNTIQQIWKCAFPRADSEAIGERALEMVLADAAVPSDVPWLALPADEDQGRKYAEVYLVVGRGVWRFRASPERRQDEQPSHCGGDYFALGDSAGFSLNVVYRGAGEPRMPVTEIEWSFWGLPEHLDLPRIQTNSRDDEQGRHPERRAFVETLVAAIDHRGA
jgi:hypothetical protein